MLHVGLQQQVDAVRQGISEAFPLAKLDQVCGLDLIDVIGANPLVADEDWEQMIGMMVMKSDLPGLGTYLKLFQDTLKLVKNSEIGDCILLFGREVKVQTFRREFCKAIFGVPQVNTSKAIKFTSEVASVGKPCHFDNCHTEIQIRESQSRLNFQTSFVKEVAQTHQQTHQIKVEGAARLQLQFKPHPSLSSGNMAARVSLKFKCLEIESCALFC
jgi:hypothetical protein